MPKMARPARMVVVGGGITGLAAAHALQTHAKARGISIDLKLLEASSRVGGVIRSEQRDEFLLEHGPDCFLSAKPAGVQLAEKLNLQSELIPTNDRHRRSFVVYRNQLHPLPEGIYLLAPTSMGALAKAPILTWPGKLPMAMDYFLPRRKEPGDESLAKFVRRRLGQEALDRLAQPMIAGIYMADPNRLSMEATFPKFLEMEQQHGSLIRALSTQGRPGSGAERAAAGPRYSLFVSFKGGVQELCDRLGKELPRGTIQTNCGVESIINAGPTTGAPWRIETQSGKTLKADGLVIALPAWAAAPVLRGASDDLAKRLAQIHYTWAGVLNFVFRRDQVRHPLNGMGMVVPAVENRQIAACTFCHEKFAGRAPQDRVLLRAFLGGALKAHLLNCDDRELLARALHDLRDLLSIQGQPLWTTVTRYRRSLPQYEVGHRNLVRRIRALAGAHNGLQLAGNAYDGVGIPDCIQSGTQAAEALLDSMEKSLGAGG